MSAPFKAGDRVNITIRDVEIASVEHDEDVLTVLYTDQTGETWHHRCPLDTDTVTVERAAPADWPPQRRDLWVTDLPDGHTTVFWFATECPGQGLSMVSECSQRRSPDRFLELDPKLVRRATDSDGEAAL